MRRISTVTVLVVVSLGWPLAAAKERHRSELSTMPRRGPTNNPRKAAEAWIEIFSLTKRPAAVNLQASEDEPILSKEICAPSMAFLAGFADILCFRMNRCYANMMTGNCINLMSSIARFQLADTLKFASLVLCYALGSAIYRSMVHLHHEQARPQVAARASVSPAILSLFAAADCLFYRRLSSGTAWAPRPAFLLALAFGMLNAANVDVLGGTITFAISGHLSKLAQGISDGWFHPDPRKRRLRSAPRASAGILGFFLLGCLLSAWLSTLGSRHVIMEASGMTLPSYLVEDLRLPLFTIVGLVSVGLHHLHDRSLPTPVGDIWNFVTRGTGKKNQNGKVDVSLVKLFSRPADFAL